jgi:hypothetical protein
MPTEKGQLTPEELASIRTAQRNFILEKWGTKPASVRRWELEEIRFYIGEAEYERTLALLGGKAEGQGAGSRRNVHALPDQRAVTTTASRFVASRSRNITSEQWYRQRRRASIRSKRRGKFAVICRMAGPSFPVLDTHPAGIVTSRR